LVLFGILLPLFDFSGNRSDWRGSEATDLWTRQAALVQLRGGGVDS
jgi:hypothetical protein